MLIIWKGWGFLAVVIPLAFMVLGQFGFDFIYDKGFYSAHSSWTAPLVSLLSTPLIYFVGNKLNNKPGRLLIDPETNEQVILKNTHDLFWIPLQYWSFIVGAISLFIYMQSNGYI